MVVKLLVRLTVPNAFLGPPPASALCPTAAQNPPPAHGLVTWFPFGIRVAYRAKPSTCTRLTINTLAAATPFMFFFESWITRREKLVVFDLLFVLADPRFRGCINILWGLPLHCLTSFTVHQKILTSSPVRLFNWLLEFRDLTASFSDDCSTVSVNL